MVYLLAYLIGSIQSGHMISLIFDVKNPYQHGSGNTGATNMWRINGISFGLITFFLDFFKVYFTFLLLNVLSVSTTEAINASFVVIIGHMYPAFLLIRGGKGVTCLVAVLSLISILSMILFVTIWVASLKIIKNVGVASSIATFCILIINTQLFHINDAIFPIQVLTTCLIIYKHKLNIIEFLSG